MGVGRKKSLGSSAGGQVQVWDHREGASSRMGQVGRAGHCMGGAFTEPGDTS